MIDSGKSNDNMLANRCDNTWLFIESPVSDYHAVWKMQKNILEAGKKDPAFPDLAIFVEHDPVLTLGRRGGRDNLKVSERFLAESGVEVVHVERGGDVTYHGPGQLVGYPLIRLGRNRLGVLSYVEKLEEAMIRTALEWNVPAGRNALNRGVWVENRKLGSLGIAVRRGIAFHGFALNVNLSLEPYGWINPCGLKGISATSLSAEASAEISMEEAREAMKRQMASVFKIEWKSADWSELEAMAGRT